MPDPSGMWWDPADSGWGVTVTPQRDKIFVVIFKGDNIGAPTWLFASDMERVNGTSDTFAGTLYLWEGRPGFTDPRVFGAIPVGNVRIVFAMAPTASRMALTYTVGDVTTDKTLVPLSFASDAILMAGTYNASTALVGPAGSTSCVPADLANARVTVTVDTADNVQMAWSSGSDLCTIQGKWAQQGQSGTITGTQTCSPPVLPPPPASTVQISGMTVNFAGFLASISIQRPGCSVSGSIAGVRVLH